MTHPPIPFWSRTTTRRLLASALWRSLGVTARLVYHTLWVHADSVGRDCFPSIPRLAAEVGVQVRAVQKALRILEAAGLIRVELRQRRPGDNATSLYHFVLPALEDAPLVSPETPPGVQRDTLREEHLDQSREDLSMKAEYPSTSLFEPDIEELEEPDPEKVKAAATTRRLDAARTRLADQDHWTAQATKSPTRALIGWWIDRYTLQYPDLRPPAMSPQLTGHARNMIRRCQPEGVGPVDAFRKAREVMEAAFDRRIWQLQGRDQAITLYTVIRQDVWDALVAVVAADRPDTRTAAERYAELKAEADARDRRMGVM